MGLVERMCGLISEQLKKLLKEKKEPLNNWDYYLGEATFYLNTRYHSELNCCPFELIFF